MVIDDLVAPSQYAFIPRRVINDNILLSHELVKGYSRKHISPRCMIKVDLQKAYDSIEWCAIEQLLKPLGFPARFVHWVMVCLYTVNYSVNINGELSKNFKARKGLR